MVTRPVVGPVAVAVVKAGPVGVETGSAPWTGTLVPSGSIATAVAEYVVFGESAEKSTTGVGDVTVMGVPPPVGVRVTV